MSFPYSYRALFLASPLLSIAATPAVAQGSGFTNGELILQSVALQDVGGVGGGIARIDPLTGAASVLFDTVWTSQYRDSIEFDAFRERLVFFGGFPTFNDPPQLYLLDGFGNTTPLGYSGVDVRHIESGANGRIYFTVATTGELHYFDAVNQPHVVMDAGGTAPYQWPSLWSQSLHYHAGTNSLFVALGSMSPWNCGAQTQDVTIKRLQLSLDGSRILGETGCVQLPMDPLGNNLPVGVTDGPAGSLMVCIDNNFSDQQTRMQLVDPVTLTVLPFATSEYFGAAGLAAGCWSTQRGQAVILDSFHDILRAYAFGASGEGTTITPSIQISGSGGSGEVATMFEIRLGNCASHVATYCEAKVTSGGCVPTVSTSGAPRASMPNGFTISASQVNAGQNGMFFYGLGGAANVPFLGGTLCVGAPLIRTPIVGAGGSGACGGVLSMDFNAYLAGGGNPQVVAGSTVHGQWWFRDPQHPVGGSGLSDAVVFTVCP